MLKEEFQREIATLRHDGVGTYDMTDIAELVIEALASGAKPDRIVADIIEACEYYDEPHDGVEA